MVSLYILTRGLVIHRHNPQIENISNFFFFLFVYTSPFFLLIFSPLRFLSPSLYFPSLSKLFLLLFNFFYSSIYLSLLPLCLYSFLLLAYHPSVPFSFSFHSLGLSSLIFLILLLSFLLLAF